MIFAILLRVRPFGSLATSSPMYCYQWIYNVARGGMHSQASCWFKQMLRDLPLVLSAALAF
jgi:hypothetical protein